MAPSAKRLQGDNGICVSTHTHTHMSCCSTTVVNITRTTHVVARAEGCTASVPIVLGDAIVVQGKGLLLLLLPICLCLRYSAPVQCRRHLNNTEALFIQGARVQRALWLLDAQCHQGCPARCDLTAVCRHTR